MVKVKICCIQSFEEARLALNCGASALGFVSHMPSGPGVISDERIASIISQLPSHVDSWLLTSKQYASEIIEQHRRIGSSTIQIVDELIDGQYDAIRVSIPGVRIVQVIHVNSKQSIVDAMNLSSKVDAILLDSGQPKDKVKTLGGTGMIHDWSISQSIVKSVNIPVYLAGGLRAENVSNAISIVKPYGIDLCSGVRTSGHLDEQKLEEFFKAVATTDKNE